MIRRIGTALLAVAAFVGVLASFLVGVLLATAFLTGMGGPFISGALLLSVVCAIVVLAARSLRWAAQSATVNTNARAAEFARYAVPQ